MIWWATPTSLPSYTHTKPPHGSPPPSNEQTKQRRKRPWEGSVANPRHPPSTKHTYSPHGSDRPKPTPKRRGRPQDGLVITPLPPALNHTNRSAPAVSPHQTEGDVHRIVWWAILLTPTVPPSHTKHAEPAHQAVQPHPQRKGHPQHY